MIDKVNQLMENLKGLPIVELIGLVDYSGVSGGMARGEDWVMHFVFDSWKRVGGTLQNQNLTIRKPVTKEDLRLLMRQIRPLGILHIQARVSEDNSFKTPQGLLVNIIKEGHEDSDLQQRLLELKKPVAFKDEKLGVFTLDRRFGWFEADILWGTETIKLSLEIEANGDPSRCVAAAHALYNSQEPWSQRVTDRAITKLLPLKNTAWLEEGESPLTAEQFKSTMRLESISVCGDGSFDFWFNDGNLFWGHAIRVSGSLEAGATFAGIEG